LRSRGFDIQSNQGKVFTVGALDDDSKDPDNEDKEVNQESDYTYVLCKIIIGRSYCKITRSTDDLVTETKIPEYDSIMHYFADGPNYSQNYSNIFGNLITV